MNLSPHFTLNEMIMSQSAARRGMSNYPDDRSIENLKRLCQFLESVRALFNAPIMVSSGYRSPALNKEIKGAKTSQHMNGCAVDFNVAGVEAKDAFEKIYRSGLDYDQLIYEFDSWVHLSIPNMPWQAPRRETLIIDRKGTRAYA